MRLDSKRRREQRIFAVTVGTLAAIAAWACIAVVAFGQITITPVAPKLHEPIVASVNLGPQIPEGAKIRGTWEVTAAAWLPCGETIHVWAAGGKHTVRASGIWVLTKDVTVGDQTFPVLMDFGQYDYRLEFLVSGGGPDPDPPDPPNPGGKFKIVMFYQADQLDNYPQPQRSLLTSLKVRQDLVALQHVFLEVLEEASLGSESGPYAPFIAAVKGDPLPRIAIVPVEGGKVLDFPLPADYAALLKLLEKPQ